MTDGIPVQQFKEHLGPSLWYKDGLAASDTWFPDCSAPSVVGLWLLLILPITQNSSELSSLWMKNVMFLEMYCFQTIQIFIS